MRIANHPTATAVAALDSLHVLSDWITIVITQVSDASHLHAGVSSILLLATWFSLPTMFNWIAFVLGALQSTHSIINSAFLTILLKAITAATAFFRTIELHLIRVVEAETKEE
ncbi:hypothetical protein ACVIHI_004936 [Bradyrhizobium sp. USDA 4524]|uniref:hypothetical protein n=1 Tax=unclassified Bradyrhizobium TaxID=2631580 RepID=UPI00209E1ABB|nr:MULTISPECIES: hypothetical protein [unclassified Bradyrhizobium]MCP1842145.1 hypothetical protein [Bradyrhizobium sp. USDA 4538]MCP1902709.1 hypothetical protein [Bradyrhizobium sp. USDA 4537]MCP1991634.1 hypothetical protein [Bradyrhizobium sp. USDA 4539]